MQPQRNLSPLPCPGSSTPALAEQALVPVSDRVAELLRPQRTVARVSDHGYEGETEIWQPRPVTAADAPDLQRQLAAVTEAMAPGQPDEVLARVLALLSQYQQSPLPAAVEAAIAVDWLDDIGEFPTWVVVEACRRWRRHPTKFRYKPLPGDIRALCQEVAGRLPIVVDRLRRLLAALRREAPAQIGRPDDVRARVVALAAAKRMST